MSEEKKSERTVLLNQAGQYVTKDRNNQYGPPTQDFQRIAEMWNIVLPANNEIKSHHVAMAMICLKLSRLTWEPGNFDSWVDIAGYAACGWECAVEGAKNDRKEVSS